MTGKVCYNKHIQIFHDRIAAAAAEEKEGIFYGFQK